MTNTEWWKHFFSGLALDLWRAAVDETQTRAEAADDTTTVFGQEDFLELGL